MQPPALGDVLCEHPLVHPAAERTTLSVQDGAIGVDFNVDHLVVTETDLCGNMLLTLRLPLLRGEATSWQREAVLSDALSKAVSLAKASSKPLVRRPGLRRREKGAGPTEPPRLRISGRVISDFGGT